MFYFPPQICISLTRGKFTTIDMADAEHVCKHKWYASGEKKRPYAAMRLGRRPYSKHITLHRLLLDAPKDMWVDHVDNNSLLNRRCNIRICTPEQNKMNHRRPLGISGFRGVCLTKHSRKWGACLKIKGKTVWVGYSNSKEEAARMHDEAAIRVRGEFAVLNFPRDPS